MNAETTKYLHTDSLPKQTNVISSMDRTVLLPNEILIVNQVNIMDLKEVYLQILNTEDFKKFKEIIIIADQITVKNKTTIGLEYDQKSITILSRSIHLESSLNIVNDQIDNNSQIKCNLYVNQLSGPKKISIINNDAIVKILNPKKPKISLTALIGPGKETVFSNYSGIQKNNSAKGDFYFSLMTIFQNAFYESRINPNLAISQFNWINESSRNLLDESRFQHLAVRSANISLKLQNNITTTSSFVPILSFNRYKTILNPLLDYGTKIEDYYTHFIDVKRSYGDRKQDIKRSIKEIDGKTGLVEDYIIDLQKKIKSTNQELVNLHFLSQEQVIKIEDAKIVFEEAIKEKAAEEAISVLFKVVKGVGEVASGNPSGIIDGIKSAEKLKELIEQLKKLLDAMKKIYQVFEQMKKFYDLINKNPDTNKKTKLDEFIKEDKPIQDRDWALLRETINLQLKPMAIDKKGGPDYLEGLYGLIIYGQSVNTTQAKITTLQYEVISLLMKKRMYIAQKEKLKSYIQEEEHNEEYFREASLYMKQNYLDVKFDVLHKLDRFNDAYRYWALENSDLTRLSGHNQIAEMTDLKVKLEEKINKGFRNLYNDQETPVFCRISLPLTAQEVEALHQGKKLWKQITLDDKGLEDWSRVRLKTVEVYLKGIEEGIKYYVFLENSGVFQDRYMGNRYLFKMESSRKIPFSSITKKLTQEQSSTFSTIQNDTTPGRGAVNLQSNENFPLPTPFTNWSIRLNKNYTKGKKNEMDVSQLTHIQLIFRGTALGTEE